MATFNPFMQQVPAEMQLPDYLPIQRQRQMAQMLLQQGMTPQQGQMVSGHYVAPSITQYLAQGLSGYLGKKGLNEADEKTKALAEQLKAQGQTDISNFMSAAQGTPGETIPPTTQVDDQGNPMPSAQMPGTPPDLGKALQIGMGSNVPALQQASSGIFSQAFIPKVPKWEKVEMPMPDGSTRVGFVNTNSPNPMSTFQLGGAAPVKGIVAEGQVVNPVTGQRIGQGVSNPNKPFNPDGTPNPAYQQYELGLRHAGATTVNQVLNQKQEGAESQAVGGAFGKQYNDIQEAGLNAYGKINRLDRLGSLLEGVKTGKLTPTMTDISAIADSLGIKIDKNLGPKQAADAMSNEIALQMRNPSGGAGMPGALSDKDREFLKAMTPGIGKTPEGNRILIETSKRLAQRDLEVAQLARDYRRQKGHMDEGFYDQLRQYSATHPLFPAAQQTAPQVQQGGVKFLGFE